MIAPHRAIGRVAALLVILTLSSSLAADCTPEWDATLGQPGMDATVRSLAVFDDGNGPALYAAGSFASAGGQIVNNIARWDGQSWSDLNGGVNGTVRALHVHDFGNGPALYVGGLFDQAGEIASTGIARWDGSNWSALAGGVTGGSVRAMASFQGQLYVAGGFTQAGGVNANNLARWNNFQWSPVGSGTNGRIDALVVHHSGSGDALYLGGGFTQAGPFNAGNVARWSGTQWSPLASGVNARVWALASLPGAEANQPDLLIAGGDFIVAGGQSAERIASWDGSVWSTFGGGMNDTVRALAVFDDGTEETGGPQLYAGGNFALAGNVPVNSIARWGHSDWFPLGSGTTGGGENVRSLLEVQSETEHSLYVGGQFTIAGDRPAGRIARWGCSTPSPVNCAADLTGDGQVNVFDLLTLLAAWGPCPNAPACPSDLNGDHFINVFDLLELLNVWGPCPSEAAAHSSRGGTIDSVATSLHPGAGAIIGE